MFKSIVNCTYKYQKTTVFSLFFLIFTLILIPTFSGIGNFWDWSFPYFNDHIKNVYDLQSASWLQRQAGTPLSYSPDIFLRYLLSLLSFTSILPEHIVFFFLVICLSSGSLGVWLISKNFVNSRLAFLCALIVFINPLIAYKLMSGHINYFPSLTIFIFIIFYLNKYGVNNIKSGLILGVLMSFVGLQIQFFAFAYVYLAVWMVLCKHKYKIKLVIISLPIVFLINLSWLSNFISGASDAIAVSDKAKEVSRVLSSTSDLSSVFSLSLSDATKVNLIYPSLMLMLFILLWIIAILPLLQKRAVVNKQVLTYLSCLIIFLTLTTGFYNYINLGPINFFTPMFREVGHFGPVIILFLVLVLCGTYSYMSSYKLYRYAVLAFILLFLAINMYVINNNLPSLNYQQVRGSFGEFKKFKDSNKANIYKDRILSYPFFGQYSFLNMSSSKVGKTLTSNVGYDNYLKYSGFNYLDNAVQATEVKDSPQYKLLNTYDLSVLKSYNVKYLFDFSSIYESNYDLYVPQQIYDNNIQLIKNDPEFFEKLMEKNPGKLKRISQNIYEVIDQRQLANATQRIVRVSSEDTDGALSGFVDKTYEPNTNRIMADDLAINVDKIKPIFPKSVDNKAPRTLNESQIVKDEFDADTSLEHKLYADSSIRSISYIYQEGNLNFYSSPVRELKINGQTKAVAGGSSLMSSTPARRDNSYVYKIGSSKELSTIILDGVQHSLGVLNQGVEVSLYGVDSANVIRNGRFTDSLWQTHVDNCNSYDDRPIISMKRGVEDVRGGFLSLSSSRQTACTYQDLKLAVNSSYALNFEYNSRTSQTVDYSIVNGKNIEQSESIAVNNSSWNSYSSMFTAGSTENFRLYLYAREINGNKKNTVNYDSFSMKKLSLISKIKLDELAKNYTQTSIELRRSNKFTFDNDSGKNMIPSSNFDRGLWKNSVDDCGRYDQKPLIGMKLLPGEGFKGSNALQLTSTRHTACTSVEVDVKEGINNLSFNYLNDSDLSGGYAVQFNDQKRTIESYNLSNTAGNWQMASTNTTVPAGATKAVIYFYAKETDGKTNNSVKYSDISFQKTSNRSGRYFIVEKSTKVSNNTPNLTYGVQSSGKREFTLSGLNDNSTLVSLGESYNSKWRIKIAGSNYSPNHVLVNGRENGWYFDKDQLCKSSNGACADGATNNAPIRFTMEFAPQDNFIVANTISFATTLSIVLIIVLIRKRT